MIHISKEEKKEGVYTGHYTELTLKHSSFTKLELIDFYCQSGVVLGCTGRIIIKESVICETYFKECGLSFDCENVIFENCAFQELVSNGTFNNCRFNNCTFYKSKLPIFDKCVLVGVSFVGVEPQFINNCTWNKIRVEA